MMMRIAPLIFFLILVIVLSLTIIHKPTTPTASPMVGKAFPELALSELGSDQAIRVDADDLKGQVSVVNFFASWCTPCLSEHPNISQLAERDIGLYGLAWRDSEANISQWLSNHGNPYDIVWLDSQGKSAIPFGIRGIPETFIIDKQGVIRFHQIGPVTPDILNNAILPTIRRLQNDNQA